MSSIARPAVKRTYGSRKPLSSRPRLSLPSSEWSDFFDDEDDAAATSSFTRSTPSFSPPTSPQAVDSGGKSVEDEEEGEQEEEIAAPSSSSSTSSRQLRARPASASALKQAAKANGLLDFFTKVSPRKRTRVSSDDDDDDKATHRRPSKVARKKKPAAPRLEQLFLDPYETAGHSTLSCPVCSLSYARTPEDKALHTKHHAKVVGGCDWVASETSAVTVIDEGVEWGEKDGGRIVMVNGAEDGVLGKRIKDILATIDRELSSSSLSTGQLAASKLVMFITPQRKVIACAVVERIEGAYRVTPSKPTDVATFKDGLLRFGEQEGAVFCSPTLLPTLLGVHRIWTSSSHRRVGLASTVLTAAAQRVIYGCPISRTRRANDIAFSQPTGAGMALARAWTGSDAFKVFVE